MSDTKTGEDGEANAGRSKTLSLKRTVESGQVRQSFSHGRSKSVLVEKRRKRTINSGGAEAAPRKKLHKSPKHRPARRTICRKPSRIVVRPLLSKPNSAPSKRPSKARLTPAGAPKKMRAALKKKRKKPPKQPAALRHWRVKRKSLPSNQASLPQLHGPMEAAEPRLKNNVRMRKSRPRSAVAMNVAGAQAN